MKPIENMDDVRDLFRTIVMATALQDYGQMAERLEEAVRVIARDEFQERYRKTERLSEDFRRAAIC